MSGGLGSRTSTHEIAQPCPAKPFFVVTIFDIDHGKCGACGAVIIADAAVKARARREIAELRAGR